MTIQVNAVEKHCFTVTVNKTSRVESLEFYFQYGVELTIYKVNRQLKLTIFTFSLPSLVSLEMWSVRAGEVLLKGKASGKYIGMSSTGSLFTTVST